MRFIKTPEPAKLEGPDGDQVLLSFSSFVRDNLISSPLVLSSSESIASFQTLADLVEKKEPGEVIAMQDGDHELLKKIAMGFEYNPSIKLALLPLIYAISSAGSKEPA